MTVVAPRTFLRAGNELNELEAQNPFYRRTTAQLQAIIPVLGLSSALENDVVANLRYPDQALSVSVPVHVGDEIMVFSGFRVHHDNTLGPYKGGTRYHPDVTMNDCAALALSMTIKCALMGLALGGAKGGIKVDPSMLTEPELAELTRNYTLALGDFIGPDIDIPAPDMGTDPSTMAAMFHAYSEAHGGSPVHGVVTGKPLAVGGINGRINATGFGVATVAVLESKRQGHPIGPGYRGAVHGFGNVGSVSARELARRGVQIEAICDASGGIYKQGGIDIDAAISHVRKFGMLEGFAGGDRIDGNEVLKLDVDLLVPASLENIITERNATDIKASLIVEGANGPITDSAHRLLLAKGVQVVPDVLANGAGVVASHLESVQNRQRLNWTRKAVEDQLTITLADAHRRVLETMELTGLTDMRLAAIATAVQTIAEARRYRPSR